MVDTAGIEQGECPFCLLSTSRILAANDAAFVVRDAYPVSRGHSLVIPSRHVADWWSATPHEREAINSLVDSVKEGLDKEYAPDGYNVGFNNSSAAGQTVFHLHIHIIPRYQGDVEDPRGGIRHVLPAQANYLKAAGATASRVAEGNESAIDPLDLIQRILAVLDEGRRTATYKPALLLALLGLAAERVEGCNALQLPLNDIADRVMDLYWQQTRDFVLDDPNSDGPHAIALRQARTKTSRIIDALTDLRSRTGAQANQPLGRVRITHPTEYKAARHRIAEALAKQPIPRLQRTGGLVPGAEGTQEQFLYNDRDFVSEKGWRGDGEPVVELLPGVADALARSTPLLRMATENVWVREVAAINQLRTQEQELRRHLFGADRIALKRVSAGLQDLGEHECYWCQQPLRGDVEVDHVIPWSYYHNDDLFNLVLAHRGCNNNRRDRLVSAPLIRRWVHRRQDPLRGLATDLKWPFDPSRCGGLARSAYKSLPDMMAVWAGPDSLEPFLPEDRRRVDAALDLLVRSSP